MTCDTVAVPKCREHEPDGVEKRAFDFILRSSVESKMQLLVQVNINDVEKGVEMLKDVPHPGNRRQARGGRSGELDRNGMIVPATSRRIKQAKSLALHMTDATLLN